MVDRLDCHPELVSGSINIICVSHMKKFNLKFLTIAMTFFCLGALIFWLSTIPSVQRTWILATTVQPETFTELYFEDHLKLPSKIVVGQSEDFKFTIHNLEYKDMKYAIEMYILADGKRENLDKQTVAIKSNGYKTILESYTILEPVKRAEVVINLIDKKQQIDFWVDGELIPSSPTPGYEPMKPTPTPERTFGAWYWQPDVNKSQAWIGNKNGKDIWSDVFPLPTPTPTPKPTPTMKNGG